MNTLHKLWKTSSYICLAMLVAGFIAFCWHYPFTLFLIWIVLSVTYFIQGNDDGGI